MFAGGSSNPAVISVVTPAESAGPTSSGAIRCTWLSMAPGVAISPYPMTGSVFGPIVMSTPSVTSAFPARPMPATRPSLIPMLVLRTPSRGSTRRTPATRTSSSLSAVARSSWVIRERMFFA